MRVALTIDSFIEGRGGASTAVVALARNLRQRGHQVMVYTAADPNQKPTDFAVIGLRAVLYERFPSGRAPLAPISLIRELAEFNPDVIHNHSMGTMGIQALAAAHLLGVPILGTCHVFLAGFLQYAPLNLEGIPLTEEMAWRYTTAFFNRFPQVTTPSNTMKHELMAHGLRASVETVSNGVDTDLFNPPHEAHKGPHQLFTILHVGRLGYEKSVDVVLRAFAHLADNYPKVRLMIVGDGPEADSLKTMAVKLGVAGQVQFTGFIPHDQLPSIYHQSDLFVTASTVETQGLVVLEAMASGLPVVGVDAMALPDLIQNGINGYLVLPGDDQALASFLIQLIKYEDLRRAMGRVSHRLALQHSLHEVVQTYERLYEQVHAQAPRPLLPRVPKELDPGVAWSVFYAEGQALKDAGVERVWEVSKVLRLWSEKAFSPVVARVRNGLPGYREQTSSYNLPHSQTGE